MAEQLATIAASPESMEAAVGPMEEAIRAALAPFDLPPPTKQAALAAVMAETILADPVTEGRFQKLRVANDTCEMLVRLVAMGFPR